ncbi:DUF262 domain-containing protein [Helicobacter sp. T3_23-1059]
MTPTPTKIKSFFEGSKQYAIPVYQRAYSWGEKQWNEFLEDLKEATKGENHYFFGNVLLEKPNNEISDIIDGQQRITTIIIFVRALVNALETRAKTETLRNDMTNKDFIQYIQEDYLINRNKPKLEAVEYDRDYFRDFIIKGDNTKHEPQTPSQERIKKAKEFFEKRLKVVNDFSTKKLLAIFEAMEKAELIRIEFKEKKDSVLMFELQNNRGKDLTNMEKLKSYLAYQIYTYCGDEAESKLIEMTKIFEEIYRLLKDIKASEDSILNYFNMSKSKFGFRYRENNNELNYKRELKEINKTEAKIKWIDDYVKELKNAFVEFKEFENLDSTFGEYLQYLEVWEVYPFILKAYRLFRNIQYKEDKLEQTFEALEIIAFRDRLIQTKADLATRLNGVLESFDSVKSLCNGLEKIYVDAWYWDNDKIRDKLKNIYKENKGIIPYLLMRYENTIRKDAKTRGYKFTLKDIENPHIEHIAPQTETIEESGEGKASGYCDYDEEFNKSYINCIGNLLLIAGAHNISIGNKPFETKLKSYEISPLAQHREIKSFVVNKGIWDKDPIDTRHEALEKFVLETWSFKES